MTRKALAQSGFDQRELRVNFDEVQQMRETVARA